MTTTTGRVPAIVYHPAKVEDLDTWQDDLARICSEEGWSEPMWLPTTPQDHGTGVAAKALEEGADLVCALGGDGTVRNVATSLAGTGTPLGVLGMGTGNLLARNLDLPFNELEESLRTALTGHDRTIDIGWISFDGKDEECFLVIAGMGIDAQTMSDVDDDLKSSIGWLAYLVSGAKALVRPGFSARIGLDGHRATSAHHHRTVLVCNCGTLQGGVDLVPDASIDDGLLDTLTMSPRSVVGWAAVAAHVITRQRRGHRLLDHRTCQRCSIEVPHAMEAEVDGDAVGKVHRIEARVDPGALVVRV